MVKSAKELPPLRITKLDKKAQENQDEIQKELFESNKWCNDWIFKLNWQKLEWVNPISITKRDKPY